MFRLPDLLTFDLQLIGAIYHRHSIFIMRIFLAVEYNVAMQ